MMSVWFACGTGLNCLQRHKLLAGQRLCLRIAAHVEFSEVLLGSFVIVIDRYLSGNARPSSFVDDIRMVIALHYASTQMTPSGLSVRWRNDVDSIFRTPNVYSLTNDNQGR
jgi:hypothetical protein